MKILSNTSGELMAVYPEASGNAAHFAALELQRYLEMIFGLKITLVCLPVDNARFSLSLVPKGGGLIAPCRLDFNKHTDEFAIQSSGNGILIASGTEFGLLFGVYAFLVDSLGVRFLQPLPGGEKIPQYDCFDTGEFLARKTPGLNIRSICPTENSAWYGNDEITRQIDWMAKNGLNYLTIYANFGWDRLKDRIIPELKKRGMKLIIQVHAFDLFLPRRLYKRHPEYFPLIGAKRSGAPKVQRCCAGSGAVAAYAENARRWIEMQPEIDLLSIQHNDGAGWCECAVCKKLTPDECFARFFAPAARRLRRARPRMKLVHYIYSGRWNIADSAGGIYKNTDIIFDTFCRCKWHRLTAGGSCSWKYFGIKSNDFLKHQLRAWRRKCDGSLIVYDNTALHGMWSSPVPNLRILADDLKFYKAGGVTGWILQGYLHSWRNYAPTLYVLARLMWNTAADCAKEVTGFFSGLYGNPAGRAIARLWLELERRLPAERTCYPATWGKLAPRDFERILKSIAAAVRQAGSPETVRALRHLEYTWNYLRQLAAGMRLDYQVMFPLHDPFALVHKDKTALPAIAPAFRKSELETAPTRRAVLAALRFYLRLWRTVEKGGYGAVDSYYIRWLLGMRCWLVAEHYLLDKRAVARMRADPRRIVPLNNRGWMRPQNYIEHVLAARPGTGIAAILAEIDSRLAGEKRIIKKIIRESLP